jgi:hypothetical protein
MDLFGENRLFPFFWQYLAKRRQAFSPEKAR